MPMMTPMTINPCIADSVPMACEHTAGAGRPRQRAKEFTATPWDVLPVFKEEILCCDDADSVDIGFVAPLSYNHDFLVRVA